MPASSPRADGRDAQHPGHIPGRGWWRVLVRVWNRWLSEAYAVWSAGLAFRALLTLYPLLLAAVTVTGLVTEPRQVTAALGNLLKPLPVEASSFIIEAARALADSSPETLGIGLGAAILMVLWSTGNGMLALMAAFQAIYRERESRPFYVTRGIATALGVVMLVAMALATVLVVIVPPILDALPIGGLQRYLLVILRYGLLAALLLVVQASLGRYAVHRRAPRWRWLEMGSIASMLIWLLASMLLVWYFEVVANFDRITGTLASLIVLGLWLHVAAAALLIGALINAESEHQTDADSTVGPDRPPGERGAYMADDSVRDVD